MLVKIQGLPFKTKYQDVKLLVRSECTITEFKLDNLVADNDGTKKVLVTVGNEAEAFCLIKCLNGFRMSNCTLSVESITTPKLADLNQSSQPAIYEPRPASNYPQARSDYPNQMGSEYRGSHTYGQPGPHSLPQRPLESMAGRNEGWNSSNVPGTQWSHNQSANSQGLPGSGFPGTPIYPQHSSIPTRVDSGSYTNRPQQSPSYGYPPKSNMPGAMSHPSSRPDMRSTDMRSNPQMNQGSSGRYPPSYQEKPITIMKDNFQGPRMYQMGGNPELYQGSSHGASQIWNQGHQSKNPGYPKSQMPYDKYDDDRRHPQVDKRLEMKSSQDLPRAGYKNYEKPRQFSPTRRILPRQGSPPIKKRITSPHPPSTREMLARRLASPERKISPMGIAVTGRMSSPTRDISPPLRRISPSGRWVPGSRAVSPPGKRITPSGRRVSPSGRRASPSGRRISPAVRRISPSGRRISPPGRKISPSGRRISPPGRRISPSGRRISPSGRRMSPPGRRISPSGRRMSPSGRRISPSGRRVSPPGRRISPSGRRISPSGRRVSPSGRGISPLGWHSSPSGRRVSPLGGRVMPPNVRVSPSGRRISPSDRRPLPERRPSPSGRRVSPQRMSARHNSPLERRMSPSDRRMGDRRGSPRRQGAQKRASPVRRLESPNGAPSRQASRYSPRRHLDNKPMDQKMDDALKNKQVRPAYESQASSQAMYSGGYRLNPKENISYPIPGIRQPEQHMSTWHQDREKNTYPPTKTQDDDRRDTNEKRHSRQSRSPVRERSVTRDQYRTNSPVSRSPRRSWALEKRPYCGSPESREVPPPPSWPGNKSREEDQYKNKFNRSEDIPKHQLVWERPQMKLEEPKPRVDEPRGSEDKLRGRGMPQQDVASYVQREPKFNPRREFEERSKEDYQRQRDMVKRSPGRGEYRDGYPSGHDERRHDEYRRLPSPQRQEPKKPDFQVIDKDLEEIYKRAQEFRKKAEQLRISGDRRRDEEHHRDSKYDSQRDRSPHRQHESDRHYDDPKYKQIELVDRGPDWSVKKPLEKGMKFMLLPYVKTKRDKAVDELLGKIMKRYKQITELRMDQQNRLAEELRLSLARVLMEMFGDKDVAFIEMVIKYEAKMSGKKEEAMVLDVLKSMPSLFRRIKRAAPELEGSSKMARYSPESAMKEDEAYEKSGKEHVPDWDLNVPKSVCTAPKVTNMPPPQLVTPKLDDPLANLAASANAQHIVASQMLSQMMTPLNMPSMVQFVPTFVQDQFQGAQNVETLTSESENIYKLFLCRDDFEPITDVQADLLKSFLVSQIIKVTESGHGWAPDLTLKGKNTSKRYEVSSRDEASKNWVITLNFSNFKAFNVLVYTDEELWYERAAIWLPEHSKYRSLQPLDKLKLQNKHLEGVNIGKWKYVKKVPNHNGIRLYVDMPPSSANALEKYKMLLSYELQKVTVILKAAAVDKKVFEAQLKENFTINKAILVQAIQNSPMPSLTQGTADAVQITVKGATPISVAQARKLKWLIIHHLFEYLKNGGSSKVDFVRYGILAPDHFGIVPENRESKRWLLSTQFGRLGGQPIIVIGADDTNMKYIKMFMHLPVDNTMNSNKAIAKLRRSNQGVKGINFCFWKPSSQNLIIEKNKLTLHLEIDLESVETLMSLNFKLDFVDDYNRSHTIKVLSKYNRRELQTVIKTYKDELTDIYDVANMELDSGDDDIICLD